MEPIIRSILSNLIGKEDADKIEIISNFADIQDDGKFAVKFRHPESEFGHDKSKALRPYMHMEGEEPGDLFSTGRMLRFESRKAPHCPLLRRWRVGLVCCQSVPTITAPLVITEAYIISCRRSRRSVCVHVSGAL